ncbi:unnamed protein product [Cylindrotheca closterium]|uniref:Uncharacterized protein n=1 Tax=Cylindrotheca closterium TaxID=2856 RepID=A0AAD2PW34_9STRA|nr:unnamed protein product [Cylindrotheca closterium]
MSNQSESGRPRKRTKIVQTALGFDAEREEDDHSLLTNVLQFVATSEVLARTRQVCRAFRKCSDAIASVQTATLIGGSVRPMIGQSIVGLLHGAEETDERTRDALKEWDPEIRNEGFDIGLPTKKEEENQRWTILAQVPCDLMAPGANVPVTLALNVPIDEEENLGTFTRLPRDFFHMNAYPSGTFVLCDVRDKLHLERNLNDTLRRIKRDLHREHVGCPHSPAHSFYYQRTGVNPANTIENLPLYKEYVTMCMNIFYGYKLGHPIPKLDIFRKLMEDRRNMKFSMFSNQSQQASN